MTKPCASCAQQFEITPEDLQFYDMVSPTFANKKHPIPPPTHCPDCRQQRRIAQCNERHLYPGECGLCHKKTFTQHPPQDNQPIYCHDCWHSDNWEPRDYGQDPDFSRPFFEQLHELKRRTPAPALTIDGYNVNSEYIHYAGSSKNCYLISHADFCENCYYGYGLKKNTSCVDGFYNLHSELCYDCVDVHKCYDLKASQDCTACSSSAFLRDCIGCKNCFLCAGLRNKEFCLENKQLSQEEYKEKISKINLGSYAEYQEYKSRLQELEKTHTFKEFQGRNLENCFGDHLNNCKDVKYSFDCEDVEGGKFCYQVVLGSKNIYDINQYGTNLQQSLECCVCGADSYHILFSMDAHMTCLDILYSYYLESCKNCFGCASMHHRSHCILNKQYTPKEYEKLCGKIIEHMKETGEWGEFLPINTSLFGYNKSTAQMYYPLTKEEVLAKGWRWDDYDPPPPRVEKTIPATELPDNIKDTPDEILNWAIQCETTGKLFRITPQELKFYRRQKLPIPRRSPDTRHQDRFHKRNPRKFWPRNCTKCSTPMHTTYSPDRPETVYCEKCYLETVY